MSPSPRIPTTSSLALVFLLATLPAAVRRAPSQQPVAPRCRLPLVGSAPGYLMSPISLWMPRAATRKTNPAAITTMATVEKIWSTGSSSM